jgi:hypothetical protein
MMAGVVRIEELVYQGEGHYEPMTFRHGTREMPSVIRIPFEFLSMGYYELRAAISAEHKRRKDERERTAEEQKRLKAEQREAEALRHRKELFEKLKAEFGEP